MDDRPTFGDTTDSSSQPMENHHHNHSSSSSFAEHSPDLPDVPTPDAYRAAVDAQYRSHRGDGGVRGKSRRVRAGGWPGFAPVAGRAVRGGSGCARRGRPAAAAPPSTRPGSVRNAPAACAMAQATVPARTRGRDSNGTIAYERPQRGPRQRGSAAAMASVRTPRAGQRRTGGTWPAPAAPGSQPSAALISQPWPVPFPRPGG
jgi:hypothetical protein